MRLGVEPREDSDEGLDTVCSTTGGARRMFGNGDAWAGASGVEGGMGSFAGAGDGAAAEAGTSMLTTLRTVDWLVCDFLRASWESCE